MGKPSLLPWAFVSYYSVGRWWFIFGLFFPFFDRSDCLSQFKGPVVGVSYYDIDSDNVSGPQYYKGVGQSK